MVLSHIGVLLKIGIGGSLGSCANLVLVLGILKASAKTLGIAIGYI